MTSLSSHGLTGKLETHQYTGWAKPFTGYLMVFCFLDIPAISSLMLLILNNFFGIYFHLLCSIGSRKYFPG